MTDNKNRDDEVLSDINAMLQHANINALFQQAVNYYQQGHLAEATALAQRILEANSGHANANHLLSVIACQRGDLKLADQLITHAIKNNPDAAAYYSTRARILQLDGRLGEAVTAHEKVIAINPNSADSYCNIGFILNELGRVEEAIKNYDKALRLKPDFTEAYYNCGNALHGLGRLEDAIKNYDKTIQLKPDFAGAYYNRGIALQELELLEDAVRSYDRAIKFNPDFVEAYSNRGLALQELGQLDEAIKSYDKAIQLKPNIAELHRNLSSALLLQGNLKDGWREKEWRWGTKDLTSKNRNFMQPQWDGSSLNGRTILLHTEQGAGDSIQFIRYIKDVAKYDVKIIVECEKLLVRLFSTLPEIDILISKGEAIPAFDVHAPLLSLPYIFETNINTIPADVPYLFITDDGHLSLPQLRSKKLNVGIVWAGSTIHKNDKSRSTSLSSFYPLVSVPDIQLFSLQVGDRRKDLINCVDGPSIIDLTESIHDYADTARIIAQLDLVISVDTSVAHLAGAMRKPTWVVLPFAPDFRWLLERDDSPWYPTMRLFRQKKRGNWSCVFSKVKTELDKYSRIYGHI